VDSAVEHERFIPQISGAHTAAAEESVICRHRIAVILWACVRDFRWVFFNHDLSLVPSSMAMNKIALTKKMLVSLDREGIVKRKLWKISPG
jgi:hypothetical protein